MLLCVRDVYCLRPSFVLADHIIPMPTVIILHRVQSVHRGRDNGTGPIVIAPLLKMYVVFLPLLINTGSNNGGDGCCDDIVCASRVESGSQKNCSQHYHHHHYVVFLLCW
jgi:hypothetical protein